ncbi:MAG: flagellar filament capping protein FliD [Elusimicrobia bacterium]|nr:flagellar filament capping protein FliD [Elusimicrobiota bacterium]
MTQINGIVSGLDTASIVSQLRALALRPVQQLEARQAALQSRSSAWDAFSAKFMDLRAAAQTVVQQLDKRPALVTTSDYTLLGVQVTGSPEVGSHTIRVQALARGQESLSQSFAAVDTPVVGAGTLRLRAGIGADDHDVNGATRLSALNNGAGVTPGTIRITDRSGASAVIDLSGDVTLQEVLDDISGSAGVRVTARLNENGNGLLIQDDTGSTNGALKIEDVTGTAAAGLGVATGAAGVTANRVVGTDLDPVYAVAIDSAHNTLTQIRDAINALNGPFSASIVNDGTAGTPYRLALVSKSTGATGRVDLSSTADPVVNELVGTGDGTSGQALGDFKLAGGPLAAASDVTALTVNGSSFDVRALGGKTGVGSEAEIDPATGKIQFFVDGVAANVTGEIRASYAPKALSFTTAQSAQDAQIQVGTTSPQTFTSRTNLFNQALPGLTMNLLSANPDKTVEVIVQPNVNAAGDAVKKYIDAFNAIVTAVNAQNTYDTEKSQKGGPLFGDALLSTAMSQVAQSVTAAVDGLPASANSIFQVGVKAGTRGTLEVDAAALQDALTNRYDDVRNVFLRTTNAARGATVSATSTAAGYDAADAVNGETSSTAFGPGAGEGWMDDTPGVFPDAMTFRFSSARTLVKAVVRTVDGPGQTAATTGIRDYDLQALRQGGDPAVEADWLTLTSVRNNTQGVRTHLFTAVAERLRLKILATNAADGRSRVVELEAHESSGSASRTGALIDHLTDSTTGLFAQAHAQTKDQITQIGDRIDAANARVDRDMARLEKQFQQMEKALSQLQGMSQSLNALLGIATTSSASSLKTSSN